MQASVSIFILFIIQVETEPHDTMAFILMGDFLFGNNKEDVSCINIVIHKYYTCYSFFKYIVSFPLKTKKTMS